MYYTSMERMSARYDRMERPYAFAAESKEEFAAWKERARKRLREITGLVLCEEAPPEPRMHHSAQKAGYREEYWTLQSEPGITVPFYLLRPDKPNGAAMLVPHGHGTSKEQTAKTEDGFAAQLARAGYFAVCPDTRGSGERREFMHQGEEPEQLQACSHREIQNMALGFGQCMVGLMVWDLMRLMDFVEQLDGVDPARIGCAGMSGGGQQTLWLAALDDRIQAAVTSGYFYGMRDSLVRMPQNCCCNYVPQMWRTMDMGDLAALIAPRPLLIESGRQDPLSGERGLENVREQLEITRRAYALFGCGSLPVHAVHEGGHEWNGQQVLPFLEQWL